MPPAMQQASTRAYILFVPHNMYFLKTVTVVFTFYRTLQSQCSSAMLTLSELQKHKPIAIKFGVGDYIGGIGQFYHNALREVFMSLQQTLGVYVVKIYAN